MKCPQINDSNKLKFLIVLKVTIVPRVDFSTESKEKLCARIVSVVTVRPVIPDHAETAAILVFQTINRPRKPTLWELNYFLM